MLTATAALALASAGPLAADASPRSAPAAGPTIQLNVLPFPGTPDAAPNSRITFRALRPAQITALRVVGSLSGRHEGTLAGLPTGRGSAFVVQLPFADGDRVTVDALVSSSAHAGSRHSNRISFSFEVRAPVGPKRLPALRGLEAGPRAAAGFGSELHQVRIPTHSFRTVSGLHPPVVYRSGGDSDPGSGYIFGDVENSFQVGPIILSPTGQLIWFQPLRRAAAFNVEVQRYRNQPVITYWQGYVVNGYGIGADVLLDQTYRQVATVRASEGLYADLHEFQITPQGTALITAYDPVHADLRAVGGPRDGILLDSVVQEIDIKTGTLLWEWHASGHVRLSASYMPWAGGKPYDFFHANSIQQLANGNLLVSARNTWAVYEIDKSTGRIRWQLGGKRSSFKIGRGANFEWQHDARMLPDGTVTLFDDGAAGKLQNEAASRALWIRPNRKTRRAKLLRQEGNLPALLSGSQGNVQVLPNGNWFVGWGSAPYFTEFAPNGHQLLSLHFPAPLQSYRGYRFQWSGQPATTPSVSVIPANQGTRVFASWNGATTVAAWRVLAGSSSTALNPVGGQFAKTAFESQTWVQTTQPYIAVEALGSGGQVLSTSPAVNR